MKYCMVYRGLSGMAVEFFGTLRGLQEKLVDFPHCELFRLVIITIIFFFFLFFLGGGKGKGKGKGGEGGGRGGRGRGELCEAPCILQVHLLLSTYLQTP